MNPRVKNVIAKDNYTLVIKFNNGEIKAFDVSPFLDVGVFKELKDIGYFKSVKPFLGSVVWPHGQDICPDTLYLSSH